MDKKVLHKISYGLYIVSSKTENSINGQIANTVFQITSDPPVIAISINKHNLTHEFIDSSKIFTVSILSEETPMQFIGRFGFKSGRDIDKFADIDYRTGKLGAPIVVEYAVGYLEAEVIKIIDAETHTIFLGKIVEAEILNDSKPMTYEYYHRIKHGKAPKSAPTYIGETEKNEGKGGKMSRYVCKVCGYVYDPEKGDPDAGIKPKTPFEELPGDWVCPVCGAGKTEFEKEE